MSKFEEWRRQRAQRRLKQRERMRQLEKESREYEELTGRAAARRERAKERELHRQEMVGKYIKAPIRRAIEERKETRAAIREGQIKGLREGARLKTIKQQTGAAKVKVGKKGRIGVEYAPPPQRGHQAPVSSYTRWSPQAGRYIKVRRYGRTQIPRPGAPIPQVRERGIGESLFGADMDLGLGTGGGTGSIDLGLGSMQTQQSQRKQKQRKSNLSNLENLEKDMFGL